MVQDIGQAEAAKTGINKWAKCKLENSERDTHQVIKKQGTTLDVPLSQMTLQHDTTIDWIDPRDWLAWLVRKGLWTRLAGVGRDEHSTARALWAEFWERYRVVQPHFQLFDMDGKDLSRTAAFLIHGDEGRTLKRQAIMVTALQSALGYGFDRKRMGRGVAAHDH